MPQIENQTFDPGTSGILAPGRLFTMRALLWAVLLFAIVLGFFFASVLGAGWIGLHGNWRYLPPIVLPIVACLVYAVLVRQFERRKPWEFKIDSRMLPEVPFGFLFGAAFITGMWLVLWIFKLYFAHRGVWSRWFSDLIFDSYISAVLEELAFRAVILRIFARIWGVKTGIILSAIIFGFAHFAHGSWLAMFGIIINSGIALGLLYVITGRLWMSIGMHLGYDFIETSVLGIGSHHGFLLNTPKAGVAAWLTGGTFGPDAAVPGMVLGVLINAVLWHFAFRRRRISTSNSGS
ncbi:CPBP family intramembrane glutamic endopeptidase [Acidicapsa dinghuensis]|uniref:CPBP family intramembrane glutamic endopeptidase n=1 Tax=Acidicapsa dinghuensis TaxID=2218256 RepID=A0ABW1EP48_9BACT|nr:type II CAAX endopeptidase family protein [Acidicapsa dinghuensis]